MKVDVALAAVSLTPLTNMARRLLTCAYLTMAFAAGADAQSTPNVSGKWVGSIDIVSPGGNVEHDTAVLLLKQNGNAISGSVGATEAQQSPILNGTLEGAEAQFTITIHDGMAMTFHLHVDGDRLGGDATGETPQGKMNAKVTASRGLEAVPPATTGSQQLYDEISHMDSVLFDAFNKRDFSLVSSLFAKDLEFYHDREGLTHYRENIDSFKRHFASPTTVRRELVKGTLEVHALNGYGAVETGIQRFYTTEPGLAERLTATSKFVLVWRSRGDEWEITRVISYDHR